ncbi:Amylopullulanase [Pontiella desulfatans]|uniref:Amylopullulanase n=1 Tax=Pontiella desulfatans TaxID=2750659 RepID=A0A6C2U0D6_PONDE|nr:hypothetical protein [Pontiella desulfatans]VGO13333.1 Amylopullulanase [Pontiella desulfatans]
MKAGLKKRITIAISAGLVALALGAHAAPLVYEPFEALTGGDGSTFVGNTTGTINLGPWSAGSAGLDADKRFEAYGNAFNFVAPYNDGTNQLAVGSGLLSAYMNGNQKDIVASIPSPLVFGDGDVMYASFMVMKHADKQADELRFDFDGQQLDALIHHGTADNALWSLRSRTAETVSSAEDLASGEGHFVVVKIQFNSATNETIQMTVAPSLSAEPTSWRLTHETELGTTLSSLQMHAPGANTSPVPGTDVVFDEIRIGTTYTDVVPMDASLLPPFTVNATGGDAEVELDWAPAQSAASYTVYRSTESGTNYASIATGVATNGYTDGTVTNNTTYYYVITSVNGGESVYSPEASATPVSSGDTTPPAAPAGLSAVANNHYSITLDWNDNLESDLASYTVYRSVTFGGPFSALASNVMESTYLDTDVTETAEFFYTVSATDLVGNEGAQGTEASAVVPVNWRTGDIVWGSLPSAGYIDLNNDGANGIGGAKTFVFQMADSADSNTLYDVALQLSNVRETGGHLGVGDNHITSNETVTMTLQGVYERGTTELADRGINTGDQAISSNAVPVDLATLELISWVESSAGILTNTVADGTVFEWVGTQTNKLNGLEESFFRVTVGTPLPGFEIWANGWNVPLGDETADYDLDGVLNLAEYALNGNPTNGIDDTETELVSDGGLVYIHAQRNDDADLVYTVVTKDMLNIGDFEDLGYTTPVGTNVTGGVYDYVTNAVPTTDAKKFIRVKIEN